MAGKIILFEQDDGQAVARGFARDGRAVNASPDYRYIIGHARAYVRGAREDQSVPKRGGGAALMD